MAADTPLDCWTCAYRKTVPFYGYSPYVCVTEQHCRRFGRQASRTETGRKIEMTFKPQER